MTNWTQQLREAYYKLKERNHDDIQAAKDVEQVDEMAQTRERQRETIEKINSTFQELEKAKKEHEKALATDKKEYYSKKLYGKGGKVVRKKK